ncbi:MAG: kynureninase [Bdellovibrionota bacterium]
MNYENTLEFARQMDGRDLLKEFRNEFCFPLDAQGKPVRYFAGNSLGLQPKRAQEYVVQELADWARLGVEGHFHAKNPWLPYHETVTEGLARIVGAQPIEVVAMNSLTVNLHLMMVSFYQPTRERYKILIEAGAFPSDQYAVASQVRFHGFDPKDAIVELKPRPGESALRTEDIVARIQAEKTSLALVLLGGVNYLTGQAFEIAEITKAAHQVGAMAGFDLAHGAGNLLLKLHDWKVDFAVWCSYKYLNSGPGAIAGCFVHERHARADLPRFAGWWGHDKKTRFLMGPDFQAIPGAEGWQLSNPPIFQLAALRASLELFDRATMPELKKKSELLTGYLEFLLKQIPAVSIITSAFAGQRGCQLSFKWRDDAKGLIRDLTKQGIVCDFREPDVIRAAPVPLYTSFEDVHALGEGLMRYAGA